MTALSVAVALQVKLEAGGGLGLRKRRGGSRLWKRCAPQDGRRDMQRRRLNDGRIECDNQCARYNSCSRECGNVVGEGDAEVRGWSRSDNHWSFPCLGKLEAILGTRA